MENCMCLFLWKGILVFSSFQWPHSGETCTRVVACFVARPSETSLISVFTSWRAIDVGLSFQGFSLLKKIKSHQDLIILGASWHGVASFRCLIHGSHTSTCRASVWCKHCSLDSKLSSSLKNTVEEEHQPCIWMDGMNGSLGLFRIRFLSNPKSFQPFPPIRFN